MKYTDFLTRSWVLRVIRLIPAIVTMAAIVAIVLAITGAGRAGIITIGAALILLL